MLRQLVVGMSHLLFEDMAVAVILKELGFGPSVMHEVAEFLRGGSCFNRIGVPELVDRAASEAHAHTWASTQGLGPILHTRAGSKPGDPLGDVVFNILESIVHKELEQEVGEHDGLWQLPPLPGNRALLFISNAPLPLFCCN